MMGTTMRNLRVPVHGTPLSICSQIVLSMCSPWSSHIGEPRLKCKTVHMICDQKKRPQASIEVDVAALEERNVRGA